MASSLSASRDAVIPLHLAAFEAHVGPDLLIRPSDLEFTTEIGLGSAVLVERGWVTLPPGRHAHDALDVMQASHVTDAPPPAGATRPPRAPSKLPCAIKSIRPDISLGPEEVSALVDEIRVNMGLQHK